MAVELSRFPEILWQVLTVVPPTPDGFAGLNKKNGWQAIGYQRGMARYLLGSLALDRPDQIEAGLYAINQTFTMYDDGFPFRGKSGSDSKGDLSAELSLLFFAQELLQCYVVCREIKRYKYVADELQSNISKIRQDIDRFAFHASDQFVANLQAANRLAIIVRCLVLANIAYGTRYAIGTYVKGMSSLQTEHGFFLENHGYDVSYQGATIFFLGMTLVAKKDDAIDEMTRSGAKWLSERVNNDGMILLGDSTRTRGQEIYEEHVKGVNVNELVSALAISSVLFEQPEYLSKAKALWALQQGKKAFILKQ